MPESVPIMPVTTLNDMFYFKSHIKYITFQTCSYFYEIKRYNVDANLNASDNVFRVMHGFNPRI